MSSNTRSPGNNIFYNFFPEEIKEENKEGRREWVWREEERKNKRKKGRRKESTYYAPSSSFP